MSLNNNHDDPNTTAEKTTFEHHLYNNNRNDSQLTEVEDDRDYTSCSSSIKHDTSNQVHPSSHQVDYDSISLDGQVDDVDSLSSKRASGSSTSTLKHNNSNPEINKVASRNPEKAPAHERITIVDLPFQRDEIYVNPNNSASQDDIQSHPWIEFLQSNWVYNWVHQQCLDPRNQYGFQMAVGFLISTLFVVVDPISSVFPNAFWVGVSVVTVLDNTVGGFLTLSLQRLIGTIIGGGSSIVIITITRAIFHPKWEWQAVVFFCSLMSVQVFFLAKLKIKPNMAYTGGIGLLTTIIITLSGYSDLIHDRISYIAELGAWRTLNLVIGIIIAMMVSLLVFPLKANKLMRFNIGKAMEDSADLYEKTSLYYLEFNANPEKNNGLELHPKPKMGKKMHITLKEAIIRAFSTKPPEITENAHQQNIITQMDSDTKIHEKIKNVSNDAFNVLAKLQTESNRLRNVSNEYYIQTIFHIFGGGRDRCRRDIRRAKRYNQAIDGMKRMVWPLVSFRLLLPLISISQSTTVLEEYLETEKNRFSTNQIQQRLSPSQEILDSFGNSIQVMRRLASILKQKNKPLSEFPDEWVVIDRMVTTGNQYINQELRKTVRTGMYSDEVADGLQLLSYYGFLVRCSMMWDGLKSITDNLSPLNGSLSRASSMGDIYNNYSA